MLRENLKDTGEILQNILTQPLAVPGAKQNISLIEAAQNLQPGQETTSDLRKILMSFLQFPEQTETMLRELEILLDEIR